MPIDASIYAQQRPVPFNNPFERLGEIRDQQQRHQLNQQAIRSNQALEESRRQDIAKQQREEEREARVRALFAAPQPPTPEQIIAEAGPERGSAILTGLSALKKATQGDYASTQKVLRDVLLGMNAIPEDVRAAQYPKVRSGLIQSGVIRDQDAPEAYDPQWFAQTVHFGQEPKEKKTREIKTRNADGTEKIEVIEDKPGFTTTSAAEPEKTSGDDEYLDAVARELGKSSRKQLSPLDIRTALRKKSEATRAPVQPQQPGPLETIIGPNGKPIRVPREQAIGKETVAGQEKPSSGVQKRVLNFFNRAQQADEELEKLEDQIQDKSLTSQAYMKYAPNFMQTQVGQSYGAAQRAFTEARLRKDSGAAIPPQEFENDQRTYFAQPGDTKETLEQKRRARAAMLASLGFESGQALGEFVGNPDEAKAIVDGYKARAAGTSATSAKTVKMRAPNGQETDVPADQVEHYKSLGATVVR